MKRKMDKKNLIIMILITLLLTIAMGYAAFSDILTISGTANAKGTFNLEFQNAEIVKNVGADIEKTTAVISEDKDTLTVNAADLTYPGSGVEFSVDIVNVGSISAEIQAVTPTNITGSDKIKVTGLDVIKADHPKIEVGDRCNIHFTVEWPLEAGEILENESSISFGLEIEYVQSTGELFEGNTLHIDTDKDGNTVNGGEVEKPTYETLVSQVTPQDYGKSINYSTTVKGETVDNWKVLYNDSKNIHIILSDVLPIALVPDSAGLNTSKTYNVYSNSGNALISGLTTPTYWSEFANGIVGATAIGSPTFELLVKSYNEKYDETLSTEAVSPSSELGIRLKKDKLYILDSSNYRLATKTINSNDYVWNVMYEHSSMTDYLITYTGKEFGIRPVVSLPTEVTGSVGETVQIAGL